MAYKPAWGTFSGGEAFAVGSVFIAYVETNPADLLGYGTWALLGAGKVLVNQDTGDSDFDVIGDTGGAKTTTATGSVSAPTFTGAALGTHSHGAGTYVPSAHAGTAVADHGSHTHDYTQVPNHVHVQNAPTSASGGAVLYALDTNASGSTSAGISTANPTGGVATGTTVGPNATLTHSVTQPSVHTMSGSSEAVTAGTPAGTNSAPTFTGNAVASLPPFIVVKMWRRTA